MGRLGRRLVLALVLSSLFAFAHAVRIEIDTGDDPNARLEIRTLVLPDGSETDLYVIEARQIVLTIDGDRLVGSRIEFDAHARVARVVGRGAFQTENETIEGVDLTIAIDEETFRGSDVLIVTGAVDVLGDRASRVPGRISVLGGRFSPCSRCGQEVEDYGFRAQRIELYPGDRLVAFEADVLIRGSPVVHLPLLVIPLAPPDRQPRLALTRGTAATPAEIAIDWPYVAGANALGTFSVRYWADVDPGTGSPIGILLGGAVERDYVGGGIVHRVYTERAEARFEAFYRPSFVPRDGTPRAPPEIRFHVRYATLEDVAPPEVFVRIQRDDAFRPELLEYEGRVVDARAGVRATFSTQGFLASSEPSGPPSYLGRSTPLQTVMRLILEPENPPLRFGGVAVERLRLDLGAFEDITNTTNRSAAVAPTFRAGRAVIDHRIEVTQRPWTDFEIRVVNDFVGRYYDTGERLVDWHTDASAAQGFSIGRFEVRYLRDINEGETPFRFDQIPLRNRSDLSVSLQLNPSPWVNLTTSAGYVFSDTRSPEAVGFLPVRSTVHLLGPLDWVDLQLENDYDPKTGDPGTLDVDLDVRSRGNVRATLSIEHTQDLAARPQRGGNVDIDTTQTDVRASVQFGIVASADASVGYRWIPPPESPQGHWRPLEVGLTAGTLGQDDGIPGLRVSYRRDLNTGETLDLGFEAAARIGPVTIFASERIDPVNGRVRQSRLGAALPGTIALEATGVVFLPPSWLGLREDPTATQPWKIELRHDPLSGPQVWSVAFATVLDPALDDGTFRDSTLQARLRLDERRLGRTRVAADLYVDARVADATADATYLRRASLELGVDLFGTIGIQGSLGYRGAFDEGAGELRTSQLTLSDLSVTARITEELYVGAILDDVWEFAADDPSRSPFNLQPTLFVAWDRCCWSLLGEWDTATGRIRIGLTAPGGSAGLQESIDTPLTLPGRGTP